MLLLLLCLSILVALRLYFILPHRNTKHVKKRGVDSRCSLAVFLGSGGHTTEALALLSALDFNRYCPRTYIVSDGDSLSAQKAEALEASKASGSSTLHTNDIATKFELLNVPRARRVHQRLSTTPFSSFYSLLYCVYYIILRPLRMQVSWRPSAFDVLLVNGPGTCFVLCLAVYINKFLGLSSPKLIYVESFARVKSLSLSGKLIRPFVDRFIVQWPELAASSAGNIQYGGLLV